MNHSSFPISLMLVTVILLFQLPSFVSSHQHGRLGHWRLAGREQPTTTSATVNFAAAATPCTGANCVGALPASTNLPCDKVNGTVIVAGFENSTWVMLCNTDFYAQDIYPFRLTGSFEDCLQYCENYNTESEGKGCAGFVFAPDRMHLENDCYLKYSVNDVVYPSTIHLIAATLVPSALAPSSTAGSPTANGNGVNGQSQDRSGQVAPVIADAKALGVSNLEPTKQYVKHAPALPIKLASTLLQPGINTDLINNYPLARDTGSWTLNSFTFEPDLEDLSVKPRLSRDGGKGGTINGTHVFMFCDTATFGETESAMGYMNGLVSSSAAIALYRDGTDQGNLTLQDPLGQWQDDVGRLRGWIEMTAGEEAFNIAVSGDGFRYAVWPESGFIPYNSTLSLIWAPVVYVNVNMTTQDATFTSLGNTLVSVYIDPVYGPHADRMVNQIFGEDEVEWGSLGGLRAWGASGNGTTDGMIYLFGQVEKGVLIAKVSPQNITDRSAYTYWNGNAWSSQMQARNSTAYLIEQPVMDFDIFYSPYHKYFFMVYLTPNADNTFWVRWLQQDEAVFPPYMPGGKEDYAEYILRYPWSEPLVLWAVNPPAIGYIYAGGVHTGYYGADDIAYGGNYLLITWTEHTVKDPNDPASGYRHMSAKITIS